MDLSNQAFIPQQGDHYYFIDGSGKIGITYFRDDLSGDLARALMRNCFRSADVAAAHKGEIMAKYAAIKNSRYPD